MCIFSSGMLNVRGVPGHRRGRRSSWILDQRRKSREETVTGLIPSSAGAGAGFHSTSEKTVPGGAAFISSRGGHVVSPAIVLTTKNGLVSGERHWRALKPSRSIAHKAPPGTANSPAAVVIRRVSFAWNAVSANEMCIPAGLDFICSKKALSTENRRSVNGRSGSRKSPDLNQPEFQRIPHIGVKVTLRTSPNDLRM